MTSNPPKNPDIIVVGSGMGGIATACMATANGLRAIVLEAAHVPGGCSSSYKRKGYVFETGATTLTGFDAHQPLKKLEGALGITINKTELDPSMSVFIDGETVVRHKDRSKWIEEASAAFGNPGGQQKFWELAYRVSDTVWKASGKNVFFPPQNLSDWLQLPINNSLLDAPILRYAFKSTHEIMAGFGLDSPLFKKFVDEQLMITAQSTSKETPFIFGAAGLTYTNYSNFYIDGGMLEMVRQLENRLNELGSSILCRKKVVSIGKGGNGLFEVVTDKGESWSVPVVVSNLPVWNMAGLTEGKTRDWFYEQSANYDEAWGAFTMGIVIKDTFPDGLTLHHQLHLPDGASMPFTGAKSIFVSLSRRGDTTRAPNGERVLSISCHTETSDWFRYNGHYDSTKAMAAGFVLDFLQKHLPGFSRENVLHSFPATPVTWQNWVYRKHGRVGGIPQSMDRFITDWPPNQTPDAGLFLCGDTVYPGQGIPGVTLSGINVYYRIEKFLNQVRQKSI